MRKTMVRRRCASFRTQRRAKRGGDEVTRWCDARGCRGLGLVVRDVVRRARSPRSFRCGCGSASGPPVKWTRVAVARSSPRSRRPIFVVAMTLGADARDPELRIPTIAPLVVGPRGWRTYFRDVPGVLRGAALVLAVLALARPQNVLRDEQSGERGIDIIVVLDLSGSMRAVMDSPRGARSHARNTRKRPTRIDTAKDVILDFISRRKTDRIGVVVFGEEAYVLVAADARLRPPHDARREDGARAHRRQRDRDRRRGRHRASRACDDRTRDRKAIVLAHRRRLERRRDLARVRGAPRARRKA